MQKIIPLKLPILLCALFSMAIVQGQPTNKQIEQSQFLRKVIKRQQALEMIDAETMRDLFYIPEGQYSALTDDIKMGYYENKSKLQRIRELEAVESTNEKVLEELDKLLEDYVINFRIDNFHKDLNLIWKAGRVKHLRKKMDEAIFFYQLAEIHDHGEDAPRLALDTLLGPITTEWLPIDEYYKLLKIRKEIDTMIAPSPVLQSMGDLINSSSPDYAPSMHPTDSILIFTSRRDASGMTPKDVIDPFAKHNEDLYFSYKNIYDGGWEPASRLSDSINSEYNEGSACLAPDGKTLYFTRCHPMQGLGDCDIFAADYDPTTGIWSNVRPLGPKINSEAWDSQPNISADGKSLYFVSNRNGGFGGTDIYVSVLKEDSTWSKARNMGPLINTAQNEVTPFFHRINSTLYFSSTGHLPGFGGYDIFKAKKRGRSWRKPVNVGPLVNEKPNEYYFSIDGTGKTIFYSKSLDGTDVDHAKQNFDLFSFAMPMEARPDADVKLSGILIDSITGNKLVGVAMIIPLDDTLEVAPKTIGKNGYFEFDLINNKRYRIYIIGDNFLTIAHDFEMKGDTTFSMITESFNQQKPIVFESLNFKSSSAKLRSSDKPALDYMVRFLKRYPQFKLTIEGHTDSDGDSTMNKKLSQKRSDAIRSYLLKKGSFPDERIVAKGYGEAKPIVPNGNDSLKAINRRVEFKLIWDEKYVGEYMNPSEGELNFDNLDDVEYDPDDVDEFEFSEEEKEAWEKELELETVKELKAELEKEIIKSIEKSLKNDDDDD
ncbi:MAG: OmpA family protein [Bacteroidia bacterium]|nr:OmpA family protein [Bacteroidia bacterium]